MAQTILSQLQPPSFNSRAHGVAKYIPVVPGIALGIKGGIEVVVSFICAVASGIFLLKGYVANFVTTSDLSKRKRFFTSSITHFITGVSDLGKGCLLAIPVAGQVYACRTYNGAEYTVAPGGCGTQIVSISNSKVTENLLKAIVAKIHNRFEFIFFNCAFTDCAKKYCEGLVHVANNISELKDLLDSPCCVYQLTYKNCINAPDVTD